MLSGELLKPLELQYDFQFLKRKDLLITVKNQRVSLLLPRTEELHIRRKMISEKTSRLSMMTNCVYTKTII